MKSEQEIKQLLDDTHSKLKRVQEVSKTLPFGSHDWQHFDREYAKLIAQYNILLEVLR